MTSPFFQIPEGEWLISNRSAFAILDGFPVSPGHSLVIPFRRITTWWESGPSEQQDLMELVGQVKDILDQRFGPDGYNVGFNSGSAGGQTIDHLHLHVIPRYNGDVPDPRGGIRHVIPERGNYLLPPVNTPNPSQFGLLDGQGDSGFLKPELERCLDDPTYDQVDFVVSFIMRSGLSLLTNHLREALRRGARVRVLTSDYLDITDPDALTDLFDMQESSWGEGSSLKVRIWKWNLSFHPKAYLFSSSDSGKSEGFIGSSNLSQSGIHGGVEWNVALQRVDRPIDSFTHLWETGTDLTETFISEYRDRREVSLSRRRSEVKEDVGPEIEPPREPANPTPIQREALAALMATREEGYQAGLVVMATGLGKTWLSAFDTLGSERVLFIAHRGEILNQSLIVFRQVHPHASLGFFNGTEKDKAARFTFASIQTLKNHHRTFARDAFDYIVVDEFHHAAASTYRSIIEYFEPKFLLGLTATPERMDGADLLSLCDDNLVFQCDLVEGIRRGELSPFHYKGLKDSIDFEPIPWRNGKFDSAKLTSAYETHERAQESLDAWREYGKGRTIGFCCSITHADFMSRFFNERGIRSAAVHSGATSAPRAGSQQQLTSGELDVIFTVDLFNEGVDIPLIETVLMLRPTESPVVFLQQLGRGLRKADAKESLSVIDFIGNHRSFLAKPRALLSLGGKSSSNSDLIHSVATGEFGLPDGCSVEIELEAVELLTELAKKSPRHALTEFCVGFFDEHGIRPSAMQAQLAGFDPKKVKAKDVSWFGLLRNNNLLSSKETAVVNRCEDILDRFIKESVTKSYKLVTLKALLESDNLTRPVSLVRVAERSRNLILRDPRLIDDVQGHDISNVYTVDLDAWTSYWGTWLLTHLASGDSPLFALREETLHPTFAVDEELTPTFSNLIQEIVDWRLADYLLRIEKKSLGVVRCRVSHSGGSPIIRFSRTKDGIIPEGWETVMANGEPIKMNFVKIAVNVAERDGEQGNALHSLLRGWFGPDAGLNGTRHFVTLRPTPGGWLLEPEVRELSFRERLVPFFSSYQIACGAFEKPLPPEEQKRSEIYGLDELNVTPERNFVAFAHGDSMNGGADPLQNGDPLLFEWVRDLRLQDLIGHRVLVVQTTREGSSSVLKRLDRDADGWILASDNPESPPIRGASDMKITARLIRRLDQSAINPFAHLIGKSFTREQAARMYGDDNNLFKWRQPGHITAGDDEVFFVNVSKQGMEAGNQYVDGFLSTDTFEWSSMNSTSPGSDKGRAVLDVPANGRQVHVNADRKQPH